MSFFWLSLVFLNTQCLPEMFMQLIVISDYTSGLTLDYYDNIIYINDKKIHIGAQSKFYLLLELL